MQQMNCEHVSKIGDNYGLSCQNCGKALEGYGCGGFFGVNLTGNEKCIHGSWYKISDNEEECYYCQIVRERIVN